jgi:hypothetical protein
MCNRVTWFTLDKSLQENFIDFLDAEFAAATEDDEGTQVAEDLMR